MKEAAAAYLAKARQALDKARRVHSIGLYDEAGRHAYYAAFHAAQALLFERTDKVNATHQGVKLNSRGRPNPITALSASTPRFWPALIV